MLSHFQFNTLWLAALYVLTPNYSIISYGNIIFDSRNTTRV